MTEILNIVLKITMVIFMLFAFAAITARVFASRAGHSPEPEPANHNEEENLKRPNQLTYPGLNK